MHEEHHSGIEQMLQDQTKTFHITPSSNSWRRIHRNLPSGKRRISLLAIAIISCTLLLLPARLLNPVLVAQSARIIKDGIKHLPASISKQFLPGKC